MDRPTHPSILLVVSLVAVIVSSTNAQTNSSNWISDLYSKLGKLPGFNICGKGITPFGAKIINGRAAGLGEFPWMAAIGYSYGRKPESPTWLCVGSLITDQYILTSAHCVRPSHQTRYKKVIVVRLGQLKLDDTIRNETHGDFRVERISYHPQYNAEQHSNDIGIIKLKGKVTFSVYISPICLPTAEFHTEAFLDYHPRVAGWGVYNYTTGESSDELLTAHVDIKDTTECSQSVTSQIQNKYSVIDSKVICAASEVHESCTGDSGGPLMLYRESESPGNTFVLGVASYGPGKCATEGIPGVYMRVSEYMAWIVDNLEV